MIGMVASLQAPGDNQCMVLKAKSRFQSGKFHPTKTCMQGWIFSLFLIIRSRSRSISREPTKRAKGSEERVRSFDRGRARSPEKVPLYFQAISLDC